MSRFLIFILISVLAISPAFSQDLSDLNTPLMKSLQSLDENEDSEWDLPTHNIEQELARKFELQPSSPILRQMMRAYNNESETLEVNSAPELEDEVLPVLKHIRGTSGVRFPTREEIKMPFNPDDIDKEQLTREIKIVLDAHVAMVPQNMTIPELPMCKKGETERRERPNFDRQSMNEVFYDVLYFDADTAQRTNLYELGENIEATIYDTDRPNPLSYSATVLSVPCLPFRIRGTGRYLFMHHGEHALRNYDKDPNGGGVRIQ